MKNAPHQRVVAYVDGLNLYYGLRELGLPRFYWLNIQAMLGHLLRSRQRLLATKYFTCVVESPPDKRQRQVTYLDALSTLADFTIIRGHYLSNEVTCLRCGHTYVAHHEKMTDVNMAVEILGDAYEDRFDVAVLLSADGDLAKVALRVGDLFPKKQVVVVFSPGRRSSALGAVCKHPVVLDTKTLAASQFPDQVKTASGFVLQRPATWR